MKTRNNRGKTFWNQKYRNRYSLFFPKQGMGVGQVFIFIIAALTFALIMIFGYKIVAGFLQRAEEVLFYQFKSDMETSIKQIYTEYGAVRLATFHTPVQYKQICFIDLDAPVNEELCTRDQIACDAWQEVRNHQGGFAQGEENVFVLPSAPIKLKVSKIKMSGDYLCLPITNGQFQLRLMGEGSDTRLSVVDDG